MHKDQLIVQVVFQIFCIYSQGKYFRSFFDKYFIIRARAMPQLQCASEFHLNLKAHQPNLVSLVLAIKSQHQTALPASKARAQTEPEGNITKPVKKLLKSNSFGQYERKSKSPVVGKIEIAQNRDQTLSFVTEKFEISVVLNPMPSTKLKISGSL